MSANVDSDKFVAGMNLIYCSGYQSAFTGTIIDHKYSRAKFIGN